MTAHSSSVPVVSRLLMSSIKISRQRYDKRKGAHAHCNPLLASRRAGRVPPRNVVEQNPVSHSVAARTAVRSRIMIHLTNAPSRGARLLARKRRIPSTRSSPTTATTTQSDLNSTAVYDTDSMTHITLPVNASDSSTTPNNSTSPDKQSADNQRITTGTSSSVQPVTDANGPGPSDLSPSPSAESSSTPAIESSVKKMKILKLANAVEENKPQGCFSSDGSRSVPSRATLSADCHHQNVDTYEKIKLSLLSTVTLKRDASVSGPAAEAGTPALHVGSNLTAVANGRSAFGGGSFHGGVNVLLGGAMLSGLILLVFFICYCCQRSARKHEHEHNCRSQCWLQDPEARLQVFTLDGQRIDRTAVLVGADTLDVGAFLHTNTPSPPPPYEAVVCKSAEGEGGDLPLTGVCDVCDEPVPDGLPTYEAALKLEEDRKP